MIYCIVPRDLAPQLHEPLRRHFRDDPSIEVVVERRRVERRHEPDRRSSSAAPARDRRAIRNVLGRRIDERRAVAVPVAAPELPRKARPHADRIVFLERLAETGEQAEDRDTARLVTRIQAGDSEAFAELYMRYFDRVYGYMRLAVRESHAAEDATQQVFVNVFEALPRYERRSQPFRAWLFVIARNEALRSVRRTSRVELVDPAELNRRRDPAPDEADLHALDWVSDQDLLLFMERLPLAQRQALALRYMLDLTHRDIAAILGRSNDDVRVLLHRAQRFLRARLIAVGRDPTSDRGQRMLRKVPEATVLRARRFRLLGHRPGASAR